MSSESLMSSLDADASRPVSGGAPANGGGERLSLYVVFIFLTMGVAAQIHAFPRPVPPAGVGAAAPEHRTFLVSLGAAESPAI